MLEYYVALDSVLRDKPQARRLLAWCRHCGIPFITDPCNAGREDLGCPFGCADLHRRQRSTERSVRFNGSPEGKLRRYRREEKRRLAADRSAAEASQEAEVDPAATVEEAQRAVARSGPIPPDQRVDHPCPLPEVPPSAEEDQASRSAEAAAGDPVPCSSEDCGGPSLREGGPIACSLPAEPQQLEFAPGIVAYIRMVISLLEGRDVHREEILEMLARTRRQHSFAREKRIDYVLRRLGQEPEKPP